MKVERFCKAEYIKTNQKEEKEERSSAEKLNVSFCLLVIMLGAEMAQKWFEEPRSQGI